MPTFKWLFLNNLRSKTLGQIQNLDPHRLMSRCVASGLSPCVKINQMTRSAALAGNSVVMAGSFSACEWRVVRISWRHSRRAGVSLVSRSKRLSLFYGEAPDEEQLDSSLYHKPFVGTTGINQSVPAAISVHCIRNSLGTMKLDDWLTRLVAVPPGFVAASQREHCNRQGVGFVDGKMVDEAIARKARLILESAGIVAENQVFSFSKR